jgi:hypothetical protein
VDAGVSEPGHRRIGFDQFQVFQQYALPLLGLACGSIFFDDSREIVPFHHANSLAGWDWWPGWKLTAKAFRRNPDGQLVQGISTTSQCLFYSAFQLCAIVTSASQATIEYTTRQRIAI